MACTRKQQPWFYWTRRMFQSHYLRIPLNMTLSSKGYKQRCWLMEKMRLKNSAFYFYCKINGCNINIIKSSCITVLINMNWIQSIAWLSIDMTTFSKICRSKIRSGTFCSGNVLLSSSSWYDASAKVSRTYRQISRYIVIEHRDSWTFQLLVCWGAVANERLNNDTCECD